MAGIFTIRKAVLLALAVGAVGALAFALFRKDEERLIQDDWPRNLAHRGASAEAPENTMEAFLLAERQGADGLELDVHMTRDGRIAVIHDSTLDRTTNGAGAVRDLAFDEIRRLDAGYWFTLDGRTYPYRDRGVRVPALEEILREFPEMPVNIEIKESQPGFERTLMNTVEHAGAADRMLVVSTDHATIRRFRQVSDGQVSTAASEREIRTFYIASRLGLEALLNPGYSAVQVPVRHGETEIVTPRFIEAAHGRGVRVDVWTIDDPAEMRRLLEIGVDTIITNRPGVLREELAESSPTR